MSERFLHAVLVLPPPVTGQTLVSQHMVANVFDAERTRLWTVSSESRFWSLRKHCGIARGLQLAARRSSGRHDLYIVPDSGVGLIVNAVSLLFFARKFRRVFLHHHCASPIDRGSRAWRAIIAMLCGRDVHIALGSGMEKALQKNLGVPVDRVLTVGNATSVTSSDQVQPPARCKTLGFLGNITVQKGIDTFCDCIRALETRGSLVEAVIAGPCRDPLAARIVQDFCEEHPASRRYLGAVSGEAKSRFFEEIDILLFPSVYKNEAAPLTILEALAASRPVLLTPSSGRNIHLPEEWMLPCDSFAITCANKINHWIEKPAQFCAQVEAAQAVWQQNLEFDQASLDNFIQALA